jgi:cellulose synthase/poly-beta-1,6-N-acetylglucosamine synthase-like glycosyltransferase
MTPTLEFLFWGAVGVLAYVYVGYPAIVRLLARLVGRRVRAADVYPPVTIIITAYNEAKGLASKLDNVASLDYPGPAPEIIVASDASADATDEIAAGYPRAAVRLLRVEGRQGKTACQNAAIGAAGGEIVVFTDATTRLDAGALRALVRPFGDPSVGCVAASLVYESHAQSLTGQGGSAYWGYEVALRTAESELGSLVGVSGCLYAVRRSAYRPIPPQLISDFVIALYVRERGLRTVLEPGAVCFEETHERSGKEFSMRVRVAVRSINALVHEARFLNPARVGVFAWQLLSHKLLRYASPFFWIVALAANAALAPRPLYAVLLAGQLAVLALGLLGFLLQGAGRGLGLLGKPYYFLLTNVASLVAALRYLRGERMVTWNPVR